MDTQRRGFLFGKSRIIDERVYLPWLKSISNFHDNCTQCFECLKKCPQDIISKTKNGYPSIDFKRGECTFCGSCAEVCPQQLFNTDVTEKPWQFIAELSSDCLTYYQISCRNCQDSCLANAIKFPPQLGKISTPILNESLCTGCGACVSPCANNAINIVTKKTDELVEENVNDR